MENMTILKNKKVVGIGILMIVALSVIVFLNYKKVSIHTSFWSLNGKALWDDYYGQTLWNRLSQGDVSSVNCQRAIARYSQENPLDGTNSFDSFYSYKKKRCFGLDQRNFNGPDGKYAGYTDKIFDLITGDTLVSCTTDRAKKVYLHGLSCSDSQNVWTQDNNNEPNPPPYPIYSNTWATLNTLGRE
ncbi:hypothetical protein KGQ34_00920 [Patescibacteria group bacterium]|nr:hypothetical protein [Patescibacteria group bacterium]